jgi:hypothetical protein
METMDSSFIQSIRAKIIGYIKGLDLSEISNLINTDPSLSVETGEMKSRINSNNLKEVIDEVRQIYTHINKAYGGPSGYISPSGIISEIAAATGLDEINDISPSVLENTTKDIATSVAMQDGSAKTPRAARNDFASSALFQKKTNNRPSLYRSVSGKQLNKFSIIDFSGLEKALGSGDQLSVGLAIDHANDFKNIRSDDMSDAAKELSVISAEATGKQKKYFSFLKNYVKENKVILSIDSIDPMSSSMISGLLKEIQSDHSKKKNTYVAVSKEVMDKYRKFLNNDGPGNEVFNLLRDSKIKIIAPDGASLLHRNRFGAREKDILDGARQSKQPLHVFDVRRTITFNGKTGVATGMFAATDASFTAFSRAVMDMLNDKYGLVSNRDLNTTTSELVSRFDNIILDRSDILAAKSLASAHGLMLGDKSTDDDILNLVKKSTRRVLRSNAKPITESIDSLLKTDSFSVTKSSITPTKKGMSFRASVFSATSDIRSSIEKSLSSRTVEQVLGKFGRSVNDPYEAPIIGDFKNKLTKAEMLEDLRLLTSGGILPDKKYLNRDDLITIITDVVNNKIKENKLFKPERIPEKKLVDTFKKLARMNAADIIDEIKTRYPQTKRTDLPSLYSSIEDIVNALDGDSTPGGIKGYHYINDIQDSFLISGKKFETLAVRGRLERASAYISKAELPDLKKKVLSVYGNNDPLINKALRRLGRIVSSGVYSGDEYKALDNIRNAARLLGYDERISHAIYNINEAVDSMRPGGPTRPMGFMASLKEIQSAKHFDAAIGSVSGYSAGQSKDISAMYMMMRDINKRGFFQPSFYNQLSLYNFHGMMNPQVLGSMSQERRMEFVAQFNKMPARLKLAFMDISGIAGMNKDTLDWRDKTSGISSKHISKADAAQLRKMTALAYAGMEIFGNQTGLDFSDIGKQDLQYRILSGKDKSGLLLLEGNNMRHVYSGADYSVGRVSIDGLKQRDLFTFDTETFSLNQKKGDLHTFGMSHRSKNGKINSFSISVDPATYSSDIDNLKSTKGAYGKATRKEVLAINKSLYADESESLKKFAQFIKKLKNEDALLSAHNAGFDIDKLSAWLKDVKDPKRLSGTQAKKYRLISEFMDIVNAKRAMPGSLIDSFAMAKASTDRLPSLSVDNLEKELLSPAERKALRTEFSKTSFGRRVKGFIENIEHTAEFDTYREARLFDRLLEKGSGRFMYKAIDSAGRDVADISGQFGALMDELSTRGMTNEQFSSIYHKSLRATGKRYLSPSGSMHESGRNNDVIDLRWSRSFTISKKAMLNTIEELNNMYGKSHGAIYNVVKGAYITTVGTYGSIVNNITAMTKETVAFTKSIKRLGYINEIGKTRKLGNKVYGTESEMLKRSKILRSEISELKRIAAAKRAERLLIPDNKFVKFSAGITERIDDAMASKKAGKVFSVLGKGLGYIVDTYQLGFLMNLKTLKERIGFIDANIIREEFINFVNTDGDGDVNKVLTSKRKLTKFIDQVFDRYSDTFKYRGAGVDAYKRAFVKRTWANGGDYNKVLRNVDHPMEAAKLTARSIVGGKLHKIGKQFDSIYKTAAAAYKGAFVKLTGRSFIDKPHKSIKQFDSIYKTADAALVKALWKEKRIPNGLMLRYGIGSGLHGITGGAWAAGKFAVKYGAEAMDLFTWARAADYGVSRVGKLFGVERTTWEENYYNSADRGSLEYDRDILYDTVIQTHLARTAGTATSVLLRTGVEKAFSKSIAKNAARNAVNNATTRKLVARSALKASARSSLRKGAYNLAAVAAARFGASLLTTEFTAGLSLALNLATVVDLGLFATSALNGNFDDPLNTMDLISLIPGLRKFGGEREVYLPDMFGSLQQTTVSTWEAKTRKLGYGYNGFQAIAGVSIAAHMLGGGRNASALKYLDEYNSMATEAKKYAAIDGGYIKTNEGKVAYHSASGLINKLQKTDFTSNAVKKKEFANIVESRNKSIDTAVNFGYIDKDLAGSLRFHYDAKKINIDNDVDSFYSQMSNPLATVIDKSIIAGTPLDPHSSALLKALLQDGSILDEFKAVDKLNSRVFKITTGKDGVSKGHGEMVESLIDQQPLMQLSMKNAKLSDEIHAVMNSTDTTEANLSSKVLELIKKHKHDVMKSYRTSVRTMHGHEIGALRSIYNKFEQPANADPFNIFDSIAPGKFNLSTKSGGYVSFNNASIKDMENALFGGAGLKTIAKWSFTSLWFNPADKIHEAANLFYVDYANLSESEKKRKAEVLRPLYMTMYSGSKKLIKERDFSEFIQNTDIAETASQPVPSLILAGYFADKQVASYDKGYGIEDVLAENLPTGLAGSTTGAALLTLNTYASIAFMQKMSKYVGDRPFVQSKAIKNLQVEEARAAVLEFYKTDRGQAYLKVINSKLPANTNYAVEINKAFDAIASNKRMMAEYANNPLEYYNERARRNAITDRRKSLLSTIQSGTIGTRSEGAQGALVSAMAEMAAAKMGKTFSQQYKAVVGTSLIAGMYMTSSSAVIANNKDKWLVSDKSFADSLITANIMKDTFSSMLTIDMSYLGGEEGSPGFITERFIYQALIEAHNEAHPGKKIAITGDSITSQIAKMKYSHKSGGQAHHPGYRTTAPLSIGWVAAEYGLTDAQARKALEVVIAKTSTRKDARGAIMAMNEDIRKALDSKKQNKWAAAKLSLSLKYGLDLANRYDGSQQSKLLLNDILNKKARQAGYLSAYDKALMYRLIEADNTELGYTKALYSSYSGRSDESMNTYFKNAQIIKNEKAISTILNRNAASILEATGGRGAGDYIAIDVVAKAGFSGQTNIRHSLIRGSINQSRIGLAGLLNTNKEFEQKIRNIISSSGDDESIMSRQDVLAASVAATTFSFISEMNPGRASENYKHANRLLAISDDLELIEAFEKTFGAKANSVDNKKKPINKQAEYIRGTLRAINLGGQITAEYDKVNKDGITMEKAYKYSERDEWSHYTARTGSSTTTTSAPDWVSNQKAYAKFDKKAKGFIVRNHEALGPGFVNVQGLNNTGVDPFILNTRTGKIYGAMRDSDVLQIGKKRTNKTQDRVANIVRKELKLHSSRTGLHTGEISVKDHFNINMSISSQVAEAYTRDGKYFLKKDDNRSVTEEEADIYLTYNKGNNVASLAAADIVKFNKNYIPTIEALEKDMALIEGAKNTREAIAGTLSKSKTNPDLVKKIMYDYDHYVKADMDFDVKKKPTKANNKNAARALLTALNEEKDLSDRIIARVSAELRVKAMENLAATSAFIKTMSLDVGHADLGIIQILTNDISKMGDVGKFNRIISVGV